jgi:hypothetical protein
MRLVAGTTFAFVLLAGAQSIGQQAGPATPQPAPSTDGARLPVTRVVVYKNGVGFFEHLGRVRGTQEVTIDLTSGQLNDVLKSLTTVDLGGGKVTGISFNTDDPANRKLGALPLPLDQDTSVAAFLGALRGARVEVQAAGAAFVGRVLSVESRVRTEDGKTIDVRELAIMSDAGELRTVDITPRMSVRVLEGDLRGEIRRYLDVLSSMRQRDVRRMSIATAGTGERQLYISYVSEVPIWKSTYRLVLPSKAGDKPLLQGWAIVDNTVGEDWTNVELSLVAGSPQSFVQQISQPLYARRPVIPLPSAVQLSPQTHEATLMSGAAPAEAMAAESLAPRSRTVPGGAVGGVVGGLPEAPPPPPPPAPAPARERAFDAMTRTESAAQGRELGELFEYRLKEPVTIRKNQSALVPIVAAAVDAERVSVWNASTGQRPRAAVWFTNATGNTLDGGSVSVLEDATFTGEGLMDTVKPGERRLLSYAADLALLVDWKQDAAEPERVTNVRIARGLLVAQREYRDKRTYTVRNEDAKARTLIVEHPNRGGWSLVSSTKPDEVAPNAYRFRVVVPAKSTATLAVEEVRPAEVTYQISNVTDDQLALFARQKTLTPEVEQALRTVLAKKAQIAGVDGEIKMRKDETDRTFADQERLRENLNALGSRTEEKSLVARYTRQLDDQETRLDTLKREITEREARRQALQSELDALIQGLAFAK